MEAPKDGMAELNVCDTAEDNLKELTLSSLKPNKIVRDTIIWLEQITDSCICQSAILFLAKDKDFNAILVYLFNQKES